MAELETLARESKERRTEGRDRKTRSDRKTAREARRQEGGQEDTWRYRRGDRMTDKKTEGQGEEWEDMRGDKKTGVGTEGQKRRQEDGSGQERGKEDRRAVMLVMLVVPVVLGSSSVNSSSHRC